MRSMCHMRNQCCWLEFCVRLVTEDVLRQKEGAIFEELKLVLPFPSTLSTASGHCLWQPHASSHPVTCHNYKNPIRNQPVFPVYNISSGAMKG